MLLNDILVRSRRSCVSTLAGTNQGTAQLLEHCRENLRKLNEKDEHFPSQICTLFNVLRLVEDRAGEKHTPGRYRLAVYHPTRLVHIPHECNHHFFVSW
jgi:hypothetical protein